MRPLQHAWRWGIDVVGRSVCEQFSIRNEGYAARRDSTTLINVGYEEALGL